MGESGIISLQVLVKLLAIPCVLVALVYDASEGSSHIFTDVGKS